MRSPVRIVLINAGVFVGMVLVLLFVTSLGADLFAVGRRFFPKRDPRAELPNYVDKERARRLYADFKKTVEDYVPFEVWRRLPMQTENVNIDSRGYRTHRAGRDEEAGVVSIGFFGGSTMWGTGVADDDTIPAVFDQITRGYAVTNHGEGGHNSRQMLAQLVNLINTRRMPQIVVFYDGFNDIVTHCDYEVTRRLNGHMVERRLRGVLTTRPRAGYLYANLVAPTLEILRGIGGKRYSDSDYVCSTDSERAEQVAEVLIRNWEMAQALVSRFGGTFFAFLQPVAYLGNARTDHLELRADRAADFRAVYPLIQAKMAQRGLPWATDLTDAFDGTQEYVYIDDAHVTRNGNAIIAAKILERIGPGREASAGPSSAPR